MRPPNAPPGLPHHPVPGLRGTPSLYTKWHAVGYFTVLLCGIPLSDGGEQGRQTCAGTSAGQGTGGDSCALQPRTTGGEQVQNPVAPIFITS